MKVFLTALLLIGLGASAACELFQRGAPAPGPAGPPPTPGAGELSVTVDEAVLTSQLNARVAGRPLGRTPLGEVTLRDLRAQLRPGQMTISGSAEVGGASVPVSATVVFHVQDGRPIADVQEARVADVPLPDVAEREIEQTIQAELDRAVAQQPLRVREVRVGDGQLTIVGTPRE